MQVLSWFKNHFFRIQVKDQVEASCWSVCSYWTTIHTKGKSPPLYLFWFLNIDCETWAFATKGFDLIFTVWNLTPQLKQKSLELQIADIKIQQHEEKLAHEQSQIKLYAEQVSQLLSTEKNLRLQLTADGEKFQQFQVRYLTISVCLILTYLSKLLINHHFPTILFLYCWVHSKFEHLSTCWSSY